jgi:hypothetical protein
LKVNWKFGVINGDWGKIRKIAKITSRRQKPHTPQKSAIPFRKKVLAETLAAIIVMREALLFWKRARIPTRAESH